MSRRGGQPIRGGAIALVVVGVLSLASPVAQSAVGVDVLPPEAPTDEAQWFALRATERLAQHLELLGVALVPKDPQAVQVQVRSIPAKVKRSRTEVTLELAARGPKGPVKLAAKGRADALDRLTAKLAADLAARLSLAPPPPEGQWPAWTYPFSVHRFLGRAANRMWRGEHRQAALMYGRAQELVARVWVPEAFEGRRLAEAHLVTLAGADPNTKHELATAAAERAAIAFKKQRQDVALTALESFLRYTRAPARRWRLPVHLGQGGVVLARRSPWVVQPAPDTIWRVDPRTGVIANRGGGRSGLVELAQDDLVTLQGRALARYEPDGRARWKLRLPAPAGAHGVLATSGLLAVLADDSVAWADLSVGELGQVARRVTPLAGAGGGVLVRAPAPDAGLGPDIALLRPGKKTPAWRAQVPGGGQARLTRDRALVVTPEGLVLLRSHDGKRVRKPVAVAAQARILGARGRYAALYEPDDGVALVDILAAERTATLRGPGRPLAATTAGEGVAVLYASGDLLFFDRDGRMLDRAVVPGRPVALHPGSVAAPGPVVQTDRGLFAFAEPTGRGPLGRDVDGWMAAARALEATGNPRAAMRIANHVAALGAGRIADAEGLRCVLLEATKDPAKVAAAARAKARADRARDPRQAVGAFRL